MSQEYVCSEGQHLKALHRCSLYHHFRFSVADCNALMKDAWGVNRIHVYRLVLWAAFKEILRLGMLVWNQIPQLPTEISVIKTDSEWGPLSLALIFFLTVCSRALGGDADTHSPKLHFRSVQSRPNDRRWEFCGGPWVRGALDWQSVRSEDHQQRQMQREGEIWKHYEIVN